jgi:hypothetical protein
MLKCMTQSLQFLSWNLHSLFNHFQESYHLLTRILLGVLVKIYYWSWHLIHPRITPGGNCSFLLSLADRIFPSYCIAISDFTIHVGDSKIMLQFPAYLIDSKEHLHGWSQKWDINTHKFAILLASAILRVGNCSYLLEILGGVIDSGK